MTFESAHLKLRRSSALANATVNKDYRTINGTITLLSRGVVVLLKTCERGASANCTTTVTVKVLFLEGHIVTVTHKQTMPPPSPRVFLSVPSLEYSELLGV